MKQLSTCLLFANQHAGQAREAIDFYLTLFENAHIKHVDYYTYEDDAPTGFVKNALFTINGQEFRAIDSHIRHAFDMNPAVSISVECDSEDDITTLYAALIEGGEALMPLDKYDFSARFGWLNDKFGVSWQLDYQGTEAR